MNDVKLELKLFRWDKATRTLSAFVSDLNLSSYMPFYITVCNPDTNQSRVFRFAHKELSDENEIQVWRYENLSHSLRMTIWND